MLTRMIFVKQNSPDISNTDMLLKIIPVLHYVLDDECQRNSSRRRFIRTSKEY